MLNGNIKWSFPLETVISIYCHRWTRRRRGKNEIVIILSCLPSCAPLPSLFFLCLSFESSSRDNNSYDGEDDDDRKVEQFFILLIFSLSTFFWCPELTILLTSNAYKFHLNCSFKRICLREKWGFSFMMLTRG